MRTYEKGRSTEGWEKGEPILKVSDVKPGDVLIGVSHQFKAENLYRVMEERNDFMAGQGFNVKYVTPDLTHDLPDGQTLQWVWHHELGADDKATGHNWFRAVELPRTLPVKPEPVTFTLTDQSAALFEGGERQATVTIEKYADGSIGLRIPGYGTSDMADGHGSPIILELWEGRLRLIAWPNINEYDPTIIDMEGARETARKLEECPECGEPMKNYPCDLDGKNVEEVYGCQKCDGLETPK